jgi:hypothetical protein
LAGLAIALSVAWWDRAQGQQPTQPRYSAEGELLFPAGFEKWVFVGSNLGLSYKTELPLTTAREASRAEAPKFHNVYINPEAYASFLSTGTFPVPTILVMDVFAAADKEPKGVLSAGFYNGDRVGLEVAVKDPMRPGSSGTAWAYYDFTDRADPSKPKTSAPAFPDQVCEACHRAHASTDNVWVQFYPVLRNPSR